MDTFTLKKKLLISLFAVIFLLTFTHVSAQNSEMIKTNLVTNRNYTLVREFLNVANRYRSMAGATPLKLDQDLTEAAMIRSGENTIRLEHVRPNNTEITTLNPRISAEITTVGSDPEKCLKWFMDHVNDRNVLLNKSYKSVGIGIVNGTNATMLFCSENSTGGSIPIYDLPTKQTIEFDKSYLDFVEVRCFDKIDTSYDVPIILEAKFNKSTDTWNELAVEDYALSDNSVVEIKLNGTNGTYRGKKNGDVSITLISADLRASKLVTVSNAETKKRAFPDEIYRLYNTKTGEHLYTSDFVERNALIDQKWQDEGVGWSAPSYSGTAVYRLYSPAGSDHLYTTDTNEVIELTSNAGWLIDNKSMPIFYSEGETPIYRLYNPKSGRHHLTTDKEEYNSLYYKGWIQEGEKLEALGDGRAYLFGLYSNIDGFRVDNAAYDVYYYPLNTQDLTTSELDKKHKIGTFEHNDHASILVPHVKPGVYYIVTTSPNNTGVIMGKQVITADGIKPIDETPAYWTIMFE